MIFSKKIISSLILLFGVAGFASAQGTVKGTVTDANNGESLIGATVRIADTKYGAITDLDGNYSIPNVPKGVYKIVVSYVSYKTQDFSNALIDNGQTVILDVKLKSDDELLSEVVVTGKANRESQNALLLDQKRALIATQAIGAMELSTKGISNAEAAVAQISGVSKQEGQKNVFIRGLADRYNATYLNGFPIPSDDPEYKNITLDIFDTDMIQSISVAKAFNARQGGDVAGAVIDIRSKELVGDDLFEVSASAGGNTSVLGNDFMRQDGADYFGFSNKNRPSLDLFEGKELRRGEKYPFDNRLTPHKVFAPVDHSLGLRMGKRFEIGRGNNPLSLLLVANHSVGYSLSDRISRTLSTQDTEGIFITDLHGPNSSLNTRQLVLANADLELNKKHHIAYNLLFIHSNNEYVAQLTGLHQTVNEERLVGFGIDLTRQQMNDNMLIVNQFDSDWTLSDRLKWNAGVSLNLIKSSEPDRRALYLIKDGSSMDHYSWIPYHSEDNMRFYSDLDEKDFNVKTSFEWKVGDNSYLVGGYKGRFINHDFDAFAYKLLAKRFDISQDEYAQGVDWDNIYNDETHENYFADQTKPYTQLQTGNREWYNAKKNVHSAYLDFVYQVTPSFSAQASLRSDFVYQIVTTGINNSTNNTSPQDGVSPWMKPFVMPSLNLKYDVNDRHTLRLGVSRSYTLPRFKEVSPYKYVSIDYSSTGNPEIKPADVWNVDFKYDWYMTVGELLSVNLFYKHIEHPLARIFLAGTANVLMYDNPGERADLGGIEIEFRKDLLNIYNLATEKRHKLTTNISGSYLYSDMMLKITKPHVEPRRTALEGASPWLLNADLTYTYSNADLRYSAALMMSYFSDRIHTYGTVGGQQKDLMEKGLAKLNFIASADVTSHFTVKVKVNNLLDTPYRLTQIPNDNIKTGMNADLTNFDYSAPQTMSEYRKGVSFSLSLGHKF